MHDVLSEVLQEMLMCATGYSGNKGVCPCYNNWKTKRGGPKCP
ncbi:Gibberellin-regulated protein 13 [Bienertia sinuspersici]